MPPVCYRRDMAKTRWAILGPGMISNNFADSLEHAQLGGLHAVGSSNVERAAAFAAERGASVSGTYQDILARDDVDAVYIGTVHTTHAELAIAALEAGKAVLCEKPVTPTPEATAGVLAAVKASGRPFLEAYKFRFGPLADELRSVILRGDIGTPLRLDASFGFAAAERTGRLFDPTLAGGAILDVGGYPASLAVGIATWAGLTANPATGTPVVSAIEGELDEQGVDLWADANVTFGEFVASIHTSIVTELTQTSRLYGTDGWIDFPDVWGSRQQSGTTFTVHPTGDDPARVITVDAVDPMAAEADAISLALAEGRAEVSEMTWAETTTIAAVLADWRRGLS
jgi:dihydrodiol dehydrogenase / D-xylose 1-dehydrogenase (NADP)